jgi:hypothetical protein
VQAGADEFPNKLPQPDADTTVPAFADGVHPGQAKSQSAADHAVVSCLPCSLHKMSRSPYNRCLELPTRPCLDFPTQKCLTLLTDKALDFWYNGGAQIAGSNIEAPIVARVREGGQYERLAADLHIGTVVPLGGRLFSLCSQAAPLRSKGEEGVSVAGALA